MTGMGDISTRIHSLLRAPLGIRVTEISLLVEQIPFKDLQTIFPIIVGSVFGNGGASEDWGLRTITPQTNPSSFEYLYNFLMPSGPIFKICYKLINDPQLKYIFPSRLLPLDVFQMLESGRIPQFYLDLLNIDLHTRQIMSLNLNPFDYYIFHFATHLYSTSYSRGTWDSWNTVYYTLACDYLLHFLPNDVNKPVLPYIAYFTGKTPAISPIQTASRHAQFPSLLMCQELVGNTGVTTCPSSQLHPRGEVWRSETVLQVFIDIWLSTSSQTESQQSPSSQLNSSRSTFPASEHVRIARSLIKQCHGFALGGAADPTNLGELRRATPAVLAPHAHAHIRHLMHTWPLDSSFRLVLELWFSYIQPWRYANMKAEKFSPPRRFESIIEDNNRPQLIDASFKQFISNNLLAYTEIFQLVVPRFLRLDLTAPKNAIMLFRLTKVFSQANLVRLLTEEENSVSYDGEMPTMPTVSAPNSQFASTFLSQPYQNSSGIHDRSDLIFDNSFGSNHHQTSLSQSIGWKLPDTESDSVTQYRPLLLGGGRPMAKDLLYHVQQAYTQADEIVNLREQQASVQRSGFFGMILYWLLGDINSNDEVSVEEIKKVPVYLSSAIQQLGEIFSLDVSSSNNHNYREKRSSPNSSNTSSSSQNISRFNVVMSPKQAKERVNRIKYMGDPDVQPVKSYENAFLVRLLQQITSKINEMYSEDMKSLWERNDFVGILSREVLTSPCVVHKFSKGGYYEGALTRNTLPPRISLRAFASHASIFWFLVCCLISHFLGYGVSGFILFIFSVWLFLLFFKGLLKWLTGTGYPTNNRRDDVPLANNTFDNIDDSIRFANIN